MYAAIFLSPVLYDIIMVYFAGSGLKKPGFILAKVLIILYFQDGCQDGVF
jgi:hypothetical protein